jgi:hypothetical protein
MAVPNFIALMIKEQHEDPQPFFINADLFRYIHKSRDGKDHTTVPFDPNHRLEARERIGDVAARLREARSP